jgi:hypothetical protein
MKNLTNPIRGMALAILGSVLVGTGPVAQAQYAGALGTQWNNPMSATISHYLNNSINASMMRQSLHSSMIANRLLQQKQGKRMGKATQSTSKRNTPRSGKQADKRPTGTHTTGTITPRPRTAFQAKPGHLLPERMAEKLAKSEEERKKMATLLHQCIVAYENQAMTRQGLGRFSDLWDLERIVSDAIAVNYTVYTQGSGVTKQQFERVRTTVGTGMQSNSRLSQLTDQQKQEMYEMLAIMTSFVQIAQQAAARSSDVDQRERVRDMAGKILTSLTGLPAEKIRITDAGLTVQQS